MLNRSGFKFVIDLLSNKFLLQLCLGLLDCSSIWTVICLGSSYLSSPASSVASRSSSPSSLITSTGSSWPEKVRKSQMEIVVSSLFQKNNGNILLITALPLKSGWIKIILLMLNMYHQVSTYNQVAFSFYSATI